VKLAVLAQLLGSFKSYKRASTIPSVILTGQLPLEASGASLAGMKAGLDNKEGSGRGLSLTQRESRTALPSEDQTPSRLCPLGLLCLFPQASQWLSRVQRADRGALRQGEIS
jgi:hypothetical protein